MRWAIHGSPNTYGEVFMVLSHHTIAINLRMFIPSCIYAIPFCLCYSIPFVILSKKITVKISKL